MFQNRHRANARKRVACQREGYQRQMRENRIPEVSVAVSNPQKL